MKGLEVILKRGLEVMDGLEVEEEQDQQPASTWVCGIHPNQGWAETSSSSLSIFTMGKWFFVNAVTEPQLSF